MIRAVLAALLVLGTPVMAETQLERSAQRALNDYGFRDVDAESLGTSQLATIVHIANSPGREGQKRGLMRSVIGRDTVVGLGRLFR